MNWIVVKGGLSLLGGVRQLADGVVKPVKNQVFLSRSYQIKDIFQTPRNYYITKEESDSVAIIFVEKMLWM